MALGDVPNPVSIRGEYRGSAIRGTVVNHDHFVG
jgi:hypothetical protein